MDNSRPGSAGGEALSDHAIVEVECRREVSHGGTKRPKPTRMDGSARGRANICQYKELLEVRGKAWEREEENKEEGKEKGLQGLTEELVRTARKAVDEVGLAGTKARESRAAEGNGGSRSAKAQHNRWQTRLHAAIRGRSCGDDPRDRRGGVLFHRDTGIPEMLRRARGRWEFGEMWEQIVTRCRRELGRAGRRFRRETRGEELGVLERAKKIEKIQCPLARMQAAWKMISVRGEAREKDVV